jgi:hypothetical protein
MTHMAHDTVLRVGVRFGVATCDLALGAGCRTAEDGLPGLSLSYMTAVYRPAELAPCPAAAAAVG